MPPVFFLVVALVLIGAGLIVSGVWMLAGLPWALIALGIAALAVAALFRRGIAHG